MPRDLIVNVDTREKRPLSFPAHLPLLKDPRTGATEVARVHLVRKKLDSGDYCLEGYSTHTVIERKGSLDEVAQNCLSSDRVRFEAALRRLRSSCEHPILMLEGAPTTLLGSPLRTDRNLVPGIAIDALFYILAEMGVELLLLPTGTEAQRKAAGEFVLRRLWAGTKAACPVGIDDVDPADLPIPELQ